MDKIKNNITDPVADTLFIPLAMKAKEAKRKKTILNDPFSGELMRKINYNFSKYDKAIRSSVGVAIRTSYFDIYTKDFINNNSNAVIVHVGCGLDTRFLRLGNKITDKTTFYELDLPQVIELRQHLIAESANNIYMAASMFETAWMDELRNKHPSASFLFVIEGVLMYFETQEVKDFINTIAARFSKSELLFDVVNTWMCRNSHRHDSVKLTKTSFKWGCDNDTELESWADNLRLKSGKLYTDFKAWRQAGAMNYLIANLVPNIKKAGRMLIYKIS